MLLCYNNNMKETRIQRECKTHGLTTHVLLSHGASGYKRYRCLKCNSANVTNWRRRLKTKLIAEFGGACEICGYSKCQEALQFHHIDPKQKRFSISQHGNTRAYERCCEEVKKCTLVCANCHAEVEAGMSEIPEHILGRFSFSS
jgi:hypothetical protein